MKSKYYYYGTLFEDWFVLGILKDIKTNLQTILTTLHKFHINSYKEMVEVLGSGGV
jgi:hypothetical protein